MKIGILVDRITPGATPKFLGREVRYLRELGYDAEAISILDTGLPTQSHQFGEYLADIPLRYISHDWPMMRKFDFTIPPFSFFSAFDVAAGYLMPRILRRDPHRYDVIVAHASITCWIANKIKRSLGIPYVAVMWDPITFILDDVYRSKLPKSLFRLAMRLARAMDRRLIDEAIVSTTGSDTYAQIAEKYTGRQVRALYPGVDIPETIPDRRGDYLLTIDRWDVGNMPTWLLDVVAQLPKPVPFKVAGFWWPPKLEEEFRRAATARGLQDQVEILGPVSEERLVDLYRGARAMIFPHKAAINFSVMEAAAHGCPTVMQQGLDLFVHGVDGFFPDPGITTAPVQSRSLETHRPANISEFVQCTELLVGDEQLALKMGRAARNLMKEHSWRAHVQRLADLIEENLPDVGDRRLESGSA